MRRSIAGWSLRCGRFRQTISTKVSTKTSIDQTQTRSNKQTYRALAVSAKSPLAFLTDTAEPMVIVANAKNATHNVNRGDRPVERACPVSVSTFILGYCL